MLPCHEKVAWARALAQRQDPSDRRCVCQDTFMLSIKVFLHTCVPVRRTTLLSGSGPIYASTDLRATSRPSNEFADRQFLSGRFHRCARPRLWRDIRTRSGSKVYNRSAEYRVRDTRVQRLASGIVLKLGIQHELSTAHPPQTLTAML